MAKEAAHPELKQGKSAGKDKIRKGILLSVIGGVLMGMFFPLVEIGKKGPGGLGPYAIGFVFSVGVFLSTFVFNAYFMKKPVQGEPLRFSDYFRGTSKEHLWGIIGGVVWAVGTLELRGGKRTAGIAGRTGNQLCARTRLDHGGRLLGSCCRNSPAAAPS